MPSMKSGRHMLVSGVPYLITLIIMTAAVIGATILVSRL
jgi:hypothetical protein